VRVSIIGAGTMGHGLALRFALGGHAVRLTDTNADTLERAGGLMNCALQTLQEGGEVDASWTGERLSAVLRRYGTLAETLEGAELVVEAIVEQIEAKRRLFAEVDAIGDEGIILASNTSYLNAFELVPDRRQSRCLIAHWYTPPYLIDLVDLVPGPQTDPSVLELMRATVMAMGQVPIVLRRFIPGYIANRIQSAIALEVNRLLDEGYATPREIDDAIIHGLALRMPILGHLAKADFTGLDLTRRILANKMYEPPPVRGRSEVLDRLFEKGHFGVKSGQGYFAWNGRDPAALFHERDKRLLALKRALRQIGPLTGE
jgi:3-hydroxybutyryl-CoA dehydrogenase